MKETVTGVILAGGLGRRLEGEDKGLHVFQDRPLVQWALERLRPQVGAVLISANRNLTRYAELGCPVLPDRMAGFIGPLAGLHAAMVEAETPLLMVVPCDAPFLPDDLVARLQCALDAELADMAIARTREQTHRVCCLVRCKVLPLLEAFLASGGRRVGLWQESLKVAEVPFDDETAFCNINSRDELLAYQGAFGSDVTE